MQNPKEYRFSYGSAENLEPYQGDWLLYPIHIKSDLENKEGAFKRFDTMPTIKDLRDFSLIGLSRLISGGQEALDSIITDDFLKLYLTSSINYIEMQTGMFLSPVEQTIIFDQIEGIFGPRLMGMQMPQFPVTQILSVKLKAVHAMSDNPVNTLDVPPGWISFRNRRINVMADLGSVRYQSGTGDGVLFPYLAGFAPGPWRPNTMEVQAVVGWPEDKFPAILKSLIITEATIRILNDIIPILFPYSSVQVAIDGVSQGAALPGPQFMMTRIGMLEKLRDRDLAAIKAATGNSLKMTYVNT